MPAVNRDSHDRLSPGLYQRMTVKEMTARCQIGVMGSANDVLSEADRQRLLETAERLGAAIATSDCLLISGATTGLPDMVSRAVRRHGGMTVGISPAANATEHSEQYQYPLDAADVMIYTGFGLKGRNVINIRSSDVVVIFGGGMGALCDYCFVVPSFSLPRIQEAHQTLLHILWDLVHLVRGEEDVL